MARKPRIKIEKGVPMPSKLAHKGRWKDKLKVMQVKDSFIVPPDSVHSLKVTINYFVKTHAKTWLFKVGRDDTGKYRCWRLK